MSETHAPEVLGYDPEEGPIYVAGTAVGLLAEIAETVESCPIESTVGGCVAVLMSSDDAAALRWALGQVYRCASCGEPKVNPGRLGCPPGFHETVEFSSSAALASALGAVAPPETRSEPLSSSEAAFRMRRGEDPASDAIADRVAQAGADALDRAVFPSDE